MDCVFHLFWFTATCNKNSGEVDGGGCGMAFSTYIPHRDSNCKASRYSRSVYVI